MVVTHCKGTLVSQRKGGQVRAVCRMQGRGGDASVMQCNVGCNIIMKSNPIERMGGHRLSVIAISALMQCDAMSIIKRNALHCIAQDHSR